jgi:hypothetical protein
MKRFRSISSRPTQASKFLTAASPDNSQDTLSPKDNDATESDKQRTRNRYLKAVQILQEIIDKRSGSWNTMNFAEVAGEPNHFNDSDFRSKLDKVLEAQEDKTDNPVAWKRCKDIVKCMFYTLSPFAKNLLTIAKDGQSVLTCCVKLIVIGTDLEPLRAALRRTFAPNYRKEPLYVTYYARLQNKRPVERRNCGKRWSTCINFWGSFKLWKTSLMTSNMSP